MQNFTKRYIEKLIDYLNKVDVKSVTKIIKLLEKTEGKIYILGNAESSKVAATMVNDLGVGLRMKGARSFDVENLSDNATLCTALANDIGYDNIFYAQLKNRLTKDDILIAISCDGNSKNILKAVKYAKKQESRVIGISGFDGGRLIKKADINFHVKSAQNEYTLVEDMHMVLNHIITSYYIELSNKIV